MVLLLGAAILGVAEHSFGALTALWAVLGPVYGGLTAYYFVPRRHKD